MGQLIFLMDKLRKKRFKSLFFALTIDRFNVFMLMENWLEDLNLRLKKKVDFNKI